MTNTGFGVGRLRPVEQLQSRIVGSADVYRGCAGSTSCSVKVIRYVLLFKILHLESRTDFPSERRTPRPVGWSGLA